MLEEEKDLAILGVRAMGLGMPAEEENPLWKHLSAEWISPEYQFLKMHKMVLQWEIKVN